MIDELMNRFEEFYKEVYIPISGNYNPMKHMRPMIKYIKNNNVDGKQLVGVEIGVNYGWNMNNILRVLPIKKLYLIDPIQTKKYCKRVKPFLDKVMYIQDYSFNCIENIPNDLDFVYIDGNHSYDVVEQDIELYYPKVKVGGVIGGHDYIKTDDEHNVLDAVNMFVSENKLDLNVVSPDWWIVKK